MRALVVAAAAVHVLIVITLLIAVGLDGPGRLCLALLGAAAISFGWLLWLRAQDYAAEMARPVPGSLVDAARRIS